MRKNVDNYKYDYMLYLIKKLKMNETNNSKF